MTAELTILAADENATAELGRALAAVILPGTVVALDGTLGAGKTRLVQAIAAAVGVEPGTAISPTFVLVQEYHGRLHIFHVDAYRMRDEDEFLALGAEEMLESEALVVIEWAERVVGCLPPDRLQVTIRETGLTSREFTLSGLGPRTAGIVAQLAAGQPAGTRPSHSQG